jgi:LPXTG-motif cell wall-anchored protein
VRRLLSVMMLAGLLMLGVLAASAAAQEDYTPEVGGTQVTRPSDPGSSSGSNLPFTGSSDTTLFVFAAAALVSVGAIFVLGTRRRAEVLNH